MDEITQNNKIILKQIFEVMTLNVLPLRDVHILVLIGFNRKQGKQEKSLFFKEVRKTY